MSDGLLELPPGWRFSGMWELDASGEAGGSVDRSGWSYSVDFPGEQIPSRARWRIRLELRAENPH